MRPTRHFQYSTCMADHAQAGRDALRAGIARAEHALGRARARSVGRARVLQALGAVRLTKFAPLQPGWHERVALAQDAAQDPEPLPELPELPDPTVEERFALGIVLEPGVPDAQGDTYDAATIRAAAHYFMEHFGVLGEMHEKLRGAPGLDKGLRILESYVAPVDFRLNGQQVPAGTWILGARVTDEALWAATKRGDRGGWSIGALGLRQAVES